MSGTAAPVAIPTGFSFPVENASGTFPPFGNCNAVFGEQLSAVTFTLSNGGTIVAKLNVTDPSTAPGTISGGTGLFDGATGSFSGTFTYDMAHATQAGLPFTFTGSGTLDAPALSGAFSILPDKIVLSIPTGSVAATATSVLSNQGAASVSFTAATSTISGGDWLKISPPSGSVAPGVNSSATITANRGSLSAGIYDGTVEFDYNAVKFQTGVRLIVGGLSNQLSLSQTGLTFNASRGGTSPPSQTIFVENAGVGTIEGLKIATSVTGSGTNWLVATATQVANNPQMNSVEVSISKVPAEAGAYYGQIDFSLPGAANSPQSVAVVLDVSGGALPTVSPSGWLFTAGADSQTGLFVLPDPQKLTVTNNGTQPLTYTVTISDGYPANGGTTDWFSASPTGGVIPAGGSTTVTVMVNPTCSNPTPCKILGFSAAFVQISFKEISYKPFSTYRILLDTLGGQTGRAVAKRGSSASCSPTDLDGAFLSIPGGFQATVGFPVPIDIALVDSCGASVDDGAAVATFSNGDQSLSLTHLANGRWTGTWTPTQAAAQASITVRASSANGAGGAITLPGAISPNSPTPILNEGGVVNAASSDKVIAPGAFIAIYGNNLADSTVAASTIPFPDKLGSLSATLGGEPLPLNFANKQQIDAVVPYDIQTESTQQLIVRVGDAISQPVTVQVASNRPGVFTQDQSGTGPGAINVAKPDGTTFPATATTPASVGDALEIFCTGLGAVTPAVMAGSAGPSSPPASTVDVVTATVGGIPAPVLFAGLAPGFAGLYQVNVTVPAGVKAAPDVPVVITINGAASPTVTVAVH